MDTHHPHNQPSQQIRRYTKKVHRSVKANKRKRRRWEGTVERKDSEQTFHRQRNTRRPQALRWPAWQIPGRRQLAAHGLQFCRVHGEHTRHQGAPGLPGGSGVKNPPGVRETQFRSLGQEEPLEKGMAAHCSSFAWETPWAKEPSGLQSMGSQEWDMMEPLTL